MFVFLWLFVRFFFSANADNQLHCDRFFLVLFSISGLLFFYNNATGFFSENISPYTLAIFRIVFYGLVSIGFTAPLYLFGINELNFPWASIPIEQRSSVPFMDWYVFNVPVTPSLASYGVKLIAISAFCCTLGFGFRFFSIVFLVSTFYINGFPNFFGKINHNHYIIWFAAILCFSPCSDVFSIDRWLKNIRGKSNCAVPQNYYSVPVQLIAVLIGIIYFFPGFHKVWTSGLQWAFSDNLKNQLFLKALEFGFTAPKHYSSSCDLLLKAGAFFTVLFELSFVFLIASKRSRKIALAAGVAFHLFTYFFMQINFLYLLLCYVVFIDWKKLDNREQRAESSRQNKIWNTPVMWVGIVLILLNSLAGIFKINSWPISCFPTFESIVSNKTSSLRLTVSNGEHIDKKLLSDKFGESTVRQWEYQLLGSGTIREAHILRQRVEETFPLVSDSDTLHIFKQNLQIENNRWVQTGNDSLLFSVR